MEVEVVEVEVVAVEEEVVVEVVAVAVVVDTCSREICEICWSFEDEWCSLYARNSTSRSRRPSASFCSSAFVVSSVADAASRAAAAAASSAPSRAPSAVAALSCSASVIAFASRRSRSRST